MRTLIGTISGGALAIALVALSAAGVAAAEDAAKIAAYRSNLMKTQGRHL